MGAADDHQRALVESHVVSARRASVTLPASGHTHTPGAGEPSPAHASWVRSWWRRARWASGTLTTSTSQRPSHGTRGAPWA